MEKAKFPMPYMNITQGYDIGAHKGSFALDLAESDTVAIIQTRDFGRVQIYVAKSTGAIIK